MTGDKKSEREPLTEAPASGRDSGVLPVPHPAAAWIFRKRFILLAVSLVFVVGLDQVTKLWIRAELARPLPPRVDETGSTVVNYRGVKEIHLIRGIFHLRYVENPAAAFSLTRGIPTKWRLPLLKVVSYLAMILLLYWLWTIKVPDAILVVGLCLVLGGAVGNAVDRHWHSYVIDFVDWRLTRFFPRLPPWPTWNIADASIVCGAFCIVFRSFIPYERSMAKKAAVVEEGAG